MQCISISIIYLLQYFSLIAQTLLHRVATPYYQYQQQGATTPHNKVRAPRLKCFQLWILLKHFKPETVRFTKEIKKVMILINHKHIIVLFCL